MSGTPDTGSVHPIPTPIGWPLATTNSVTIPVIGSVVNGNGTVMTTDGSAMVGAGTTMMTTSSESKGMVLGNSLGLSLANVTEHENPRLCPTRIEVSAIDGRIAVCGDEGKCTYFAVTPFPRIPAGSITSAGFRAETFGADGDS
jgi:hypothetical protein